MITGTLPVFLRSDCDIVGLASHIRATPGFAGGNWPHEMSLEDNLRDLEQHAQDFAKRRGFTYTVLSSDADEVIGCV